MVFSAYDLQPQPRFVYALDGAETRHTLMLGRGLQEQTSRAAWDGGTLRHHDRAPRRGSGVGHVRSAIEVTQRLTLESPTSLVVEATRSGRLGGAPTVDDTKRRV